ncbi:hypothetical protein GGI18_006158, partial [Coemansia linderi]
QLWWVQFSAESGHRHGGAQGRRNAAGQAGVGNGECARADQQHKQTVLQNVHSQPGPVAEQLGAGQPVAVHGQVPGQLGHSIAGIRCARDAGKPL